MKPVVTILTLYVVAVIAYRASLMLVPEGMVLMAAIEGLTPRWFLSSSRH